jgi:hypothetical protein
MEDYNMRVGADSETLETKCIIPFMNKEPFDYTEWQQGLYEDMTVEELSNKAMENRRSKANAVAN